jgi:phospholipid transport system transporter-binding protein
MALALHDEHRLDVSGDLTLDSVAQLFEQSRSLLPGQVRTIDLQNVSRVDSAGLALLLEWQSAATQRNGALAFTNAPEDLSRLAALCEATRLLGLSPRKSPDA